MSHRYREELRRRAAHDDAAFIEYMADLVVPDHLREMSAFVSRHRRAVVLEPRGFGKTTLLCYRAARLVGLARGAIRIGILCAVDEDAENLAAAIRRIVEHPRFAEVFPWAAAGVEGPRWRDGAWTVRGVELGKDVTCRALSLGSVHAGPRLDLLLADDPVGIQENATPAGRAKVLDTLLEVVLPMLVPNGRVVVSGTRWHEDDLYAQLIARDWQALVRRAIEEGRSLWPEWFSLEALAERQAALGSALFAAQYMNDPSALGGEVFRREWFTRIDVVPAGISRRVGVDLAALSTARDAPAAVRRGDRGPGPPAAAERGEYRVDRIPDRLRPRARPPHRPAGPRRATRSRPCDPGATGRGAHGGRQGGVLDSGPGPRRARGGARRVPQRRPRRPSRRVGLCGRSRRTDGACAPAADRRQAHLFVQPER